MALVSSSSPCSSHPFPSSDRWNCRLSSSSSSPLHTSMAASRRLRCRPIAASSLCTDNQTIPPSSAIDRSAVSVAEAFSEDQLWAAASLRVRSFYEFNPSSYRIEVSLFLVCLSVCLFPEKMRENRSTFFDSLISLSVFLSFPNEKIKEKLLLFVILSIIQLESIIIYCWQDQFYGMDN